MALNRLSFFQRIRCSVESNCRHKCLARYYHRSFGDNVMCNNIHWSKYSGSVLSMKHLPQRENSSVQEIPFKKSKSTWTKEMPLSQKLGKEKSIIPNLLALMNPELVPATEKRDVIHEIYDQIIKDNGCRYLNTEEWKFIELSSEFDGRKSFEGGRGLVRLFEMIALRPYEDGLLGFGLSLHSYILNHTELKIHPLVTKVSLMKLKMNQYSGGHGEDPTEEVLKMYVDLCEEYDGFDSTTIYSLIHILCLTPHWEDSIQLLDMIRITSEPTTQHYSPIVASAFRHGQKDVGFSLLEDMSEGYMEPTDDVFFAFLNANITLDDVDNFLLFVQQKDWIISDVVAKALKNWFESYRMAGRSDLRWQGNFVTVKKSPVCPSCGQGLESIQPLSTPEFMQLKDTFMAKALKKKDVFQNTSPDELSEFEDFLNRQAPFDVVIDGLNTAHGNVQSATDKMKANTLKAVVEHFVVRKQKRVLVLGRKHMHKWPQPTMRIISQLAQCFYTQNSSEDDPFLLYAALCSGRYCRFVTRDEFRDHRHLLGDTLSGVFKRWQLTSQVPFYGQFKDARGKIYLNFKWPNSYRTRVHRTSGGNWHIPYEDGRARESYQVTTSWLCISR